MTIDTASTEMPPGAASHGDIDSRSAPSAISSIAPPLQGLLGEGKAQVKSTLDGVVVAARDIAAKLDDKGAAPLAKHIHSAAETVAGWAETVEHKSVDDLLSDTQTLVRTNPALAIAVAVAAGFAVSRIVWAR